MELYESVKGRYHNNGIQVMQKHSGETSLIPIVMSNMPAATISANSHKAMIQPNISTDLTNSYFSKQKQL